MRINRFKGSLFFILFLIAGSYAKDNVNLNLSADVLSFTHAKKMIHAGGHVVVKYKDKTLYAFELEIDLQTNRVVARGNVILVENNGNTLYADQLTLSKDLARGLIHHFKMELFGTYLWGKTFKKDHDLSTANDAGFTPCHGYKKGAASWKVEAKKIIHDNKALTIKFEDVSLFFHDQKFFALPSMTIPDPRVRYKNGFLFPVIGMNGPLGAYIVPQYYYNISPYQDMTIGVIGSSKKNYGLETQHRFKTHRLKSKLDIKGMVIDKDAKELMEKKQQYHIQWNVDYDINPSTQLIMRIDRSRKTAFSSYSEFNENQFQYSNNATVPSDIGVYHLRDNGLFKVEATSFQASFNQSHVAHMLPRISWNESFGDFSIDTQAVYLTRRVPYIDEVGNKRPKGYLRFSFLPSYNKLYVSDGGVCFDTELGCETSYQFNSDYKIPNANNGSGEAFKRNLYYISPYINEIIRYPFLVEIISKQVVIEPTIAFYYQRYKQSPYPSPQEDAFLNYFDDTNMFDASRFAGGDGSDYGARVTTGCNVKVSNATFFLGKSYRLDGSQPFRPYEGRQSFWVSKASYRVKNWGVEWKALFTPNGQMMLNEMACSFTKGMWNVDIAHVYENQIIPQEVKNPKTSSQIIYQIKFKIASNLKIHFAQTYNLKKKHAPFYINNFAGFEYSDDDECFTIGLGVGRKYVHYEEQKNGKKSSRVIPDNMFLLKFCFRPFSDPGAFNKPLIPRFPLNHHMS